MSVPRTVAAATAFMVAALAVGAAVAPALAQDQGPSSSASSGLAVEDGAGGALTVVPARVDPGGEVTVTVECPTIPSVVYGRGYDVVMSVPPGDGLQAGTSTVVIPADVAADLPVVATCGAAEPMRVLVDVEHPAIGKVPIGSMLPEPNGLSPLYGSDCPDGTEASIRITNWDYGDGPQGGASYVVTQPIDESGDWSMTAPAIAAYGVAPTSPVPEGTVLRELWLDASCGDVRYPRVTMVVQEATEPTVHGESLLPTLLPSTPPGDAAPATPQRGSAGYTG